MPTKVESSIKNKVELARSGFVYAHDQVRTDEQYLELVHALSYSAIHRLTVFELLVYDQEWAFTFALDC